METLRLLVVEESLNVAEEYATCVRNSGMAVRLKKVEDTAELEQAVKEQEFDMLLTPMTLNDYSVFRAIEIMDRNKLDLPIIILLSGQENEATVVEVLEKGAMDAVRSDREERLQIIVNREAKNLHRRRTLKKAMMALTEAEKRCRQLIDSSRDAIAYVHDGMHVYANGVYLEMFGYSDLDEIEGMPIMDMISGEDHQKFKNFLKNYKISKSSEQKLPIKGKRLDESCFDAVMEFAPATVDMEPCTQIIIRDQSNTKELEKKLKYISNQDLLTGLYNRQYLMEELQLYIGRAKSEGGGGHLLYIELDNFGQVKEKAGIGGQDVVLNDFSNILKVTTQKIPGTLLARITDSVFTVLLAEKPLDLARKLSEAIRKTLEDFIFDIEGNSVTLTCSIGIVPVTEKSQDAQTIVNQADLACSLAKKGGGNRVHVHDPLKDAGATSDRDLQWVTLVRTALEKNFFHTVYQPIVSLHGGDSEIYEVLIRIKDKEGRIIMPGQFLPSADAAGLMPAIDRWVVDNAVNTLHQQRQQGHTTRFFIKISAATLKDETFLPWLARRLSQARMRGDSIVFEIAEKDVMQHLKYGKYFCKGIHELHSKVALDHFGTGANSFNNLKHIDVDFLKIDGSFIHNLAGDKKNQAMVKSINEMAQSMGKVTIAEFVQDATSLAMLWQFGVNFIQGNYLQKPYENLTYDFTSESEIV